MALQTSRIAAEAERITGFFGRSFPTVRPPTGPEDRGGCFTLLADLPPGGVWDLDLASAETVEFCTLTVEETRNGIRTGDDVLGATDNGPSTSVD